MRIIVASRLTATANTACAGNPKRVRIPVSHFRIPRSFEVPIRILCVSNTPEAGTRRLIFAGLAVLLVAVAGCQRQAKPAPAPAPKVAGEKITFATNGPQLGYLIIETAQERKAVAAGLYGRLAWDDDVTVRVFSPVAGRVTALQAEVNVAVSKGDVLASLASPDYAQMQNDARKAASEMALAGRTITRLRELSQHGAAAQKDVEAAEAAYANAKSEYERATSQLRTISFGRTNSAPGNYDLCSPLGGIVVEKKISPGQQIRSDQSENPLFVVTDPTRLWLFLDVTEMDVASLSPNQEVLIHTKAFPDRTFHGQLEIIGGGLDAATRTIKARCVVDNSEKLLRAETYVSADVSASTVSGVDVSSKAILLKNNRHYVFVETAPGQFERRTVKLGVESNGRSVIVDGLAAGQRVVTDGCLLLEAMLEGDNS